MDVAKDEGLDTIVYVGIGVDVLLAIVATILLIWWRNRSKKLKKEEVETTKINKLEVDETATTTLTTVDMNVNVQRIEVNKHVHPVLPWPRTPPPSIPDTNAMDLLMGDFAFLNDHMDGISGFSVSMNSDPGEAGDGKFHLKTKDGETMEYFLPMDVDCTVKRNPLILAPSELTKTEVVTLDSSPTGDLDVTTYYTYNAPVSGWDHDENQTQTEAVKDEHSTALPPPLCLGLHDESTEVM